MISGSAAQTHDHTDVGPDATVRFWSLGWWVRHGTGQRKEIAYTKGRLGPTAPSRWPRRCVTIAKENAPAEADPSSPPPACPAKLAPFPHPFHPRPSARGVAPDPTERMARRPHTPPGARRVAPTPHRAHGASPPHPTERTVREIVLPRHSASSRHRACGNGLGGARSTGTFGHAKHGVCDQIRMTFSTEHHPTRPVTPHNTTPRARSPPRTPPHAPGHPSPHHPTRPVTPHNTTPRARSPLTTPPHAPGRQTAERAGRPVVVPPVPSGSHRVRDPAGVT